MSVVDHQIDSGKSRAPICRKQYDPSRALLNLIRREHFTITRSGKSSTFTESVETSTDPLKTTLVDREQY